MWRKYLATPLCLEDIESITKELKDLLGYSDKYALKARVSSLHHADFASVLERCDSKFRNALIPHIIDNIKPETLVWLSDYVKSILVDILGSKTTADIIEALDSEDAVDVVESFTPSQRRDIVKFLSSEKQQYIADGLQYGAHLVGRIMEREVLVFAAHWSVENAISALKKYDENCENHDAIIVNDAYIPVGTISLNKLIKHEKSARISDVMNKEIVTLNTHASIDDLVYLFRQYDPSIVAIITKTGKLIGNISSKNMVHIAYENVEQDMMQYVGLQGADNFMSFFRISRQRFLWLFLNLLTACLTSKIIGQFEGMISKFVTLAAIMPIVASLGGNAGTQVMTITVRALANRCIDKSNAFQVVLREVFICGFNGFILGCLGFCAIWLITGKMDLSIVFGVAVFLNFMIAGLFGSLVPIISNAMKFDPASCSGVILTAITDSCGFATFLSLSYIFLL